MAAPDFESIGAKLKSSDLKTKLNLLTELRDEIESATQTNDCQPFYTNVLPLFESMLMNEIPVAFTDDSLEHKTRLIILEIIQRVPCNELLKPHVTWLLKLIMHVLRVDNEEIASICLRILIELHKNFRSLPGLEDFVQPFFDFFQHLLKIMPHNINNFIDFPSNDYLETLPITPVIGNENNSQQHSQQQSQQKKTFLPSENSFKVLSECPIILVLLFQLYKKYVSLNIPTLAPLIVETVSLRSRLQVSFTRADPVSLVCGRSPEIQSISTFTELIGAQVKIISFLAYMIRGFASVLKPHQTVIAESVINVFLDCPVDASSIRKELLVAARHILSTEFRSSFIPFMDVLFNEKLLVGVGVTSRETLSMLADLIHHVRQDLTTEQISRTVALYVQNLHDITLAPSIQTMCAKLLLNLVDCIVNQPSKEEVRRTIVLLLDAFTGKFTALTIAIPKLERRFQKQELSLGDKSLIDYKSLVDMEHLAPVRISSPGLDHDQPDIVKDCKFLFKTLVLGLKTLVYALKTCLSPAPPQNPIAGGFASFKGISPVEIELFVRMFRDGLSCFRIFHIDPIPSGGSGMSTIQSSVNGGGDAGNDSAVLSAQQLQARQAAIAKEEKEILEHFVAAFSIIDPAVFLEVFSSQIDFFYDVLKKDIAMLAVPQYVLATEMVSRNFASVLINFLMQRFEDLGQSDQNTAGLLLRLFKLVFTSVTLYPDSNESVLQPHMTDLITRSLKCASKAKEPNNYFVLLRALFRNIGGGRYESLYKEVLPLLPFLLKSLNTLLAVTEKPSMRDLFVELCLTVPVRLSVLLPYLHYLMRPLVLALQAGPELISQGLRTLELCIDNLTADFLDPIMQPVIQEMMQALWRHLRPLPYSQAHAHTTLRILGKLGGRNRRMLRETIMIHSRPVSGLYLPLRLPLSTAAAGGAISGASAGGNVYKIPLEAALQQANSVLTAAAVPSATANNSAATAIELESAFTIVTAALRLLVDLRPIDSAKLSKYLLQRFVPKTNTGSSGKHSTSDPMSVDEVAELCSADAKPQSAQHAAETGLKQVLLLLLYCRSVETLRERAEPLLDGLIHHFALIIVVQISSTSSSTAQSLLVECLVDALSSELPNLAINAQNSLNLLFTSIVEIFSVVVGESDGSDILTTTIQSLANSLAARLCSECYRVEWYRKMGGARGISLLCTGLSQLSSDWAAAHQLEFVRALLFVFKDLSPDLAVGSLQEISDTFMALIRQCHSADAHLSQPVNGAAGDLIDGVSTVGSGNSNLLNLLIAELPNPNDSVRRHVKRSLALLAELSPGRSLTDLLMSSRDRFLVPIFSKPLRALPFQMQIGNIDAICYALSLEPPLLQFNDELIRLLHEALALADADDQALTSKTTHQQNAASITNLRTVCVQLLSVAMSHAEFSTSPKLSPTRYRVVQAPEVVEAASRGLQQAISQQNKLPKELLQQGLRPILLNLSDHKRLTVEGLQGLGRLLELLTSYFKVEIGKKLLDHLHQWATPQCLETAAMRPTEESQELRIIAGILDVIHLLPPTAHIFMDDMMRAIVGLEESLRRNLSSPFRKPTLRYLNKYPQHAAKYLLDNLSQPRVLHLFTVLLESDDLPNSPAGDPAAALTAMAPSQNAETTALPLRAAIESIMLDILAAAEIGATNGPASTAQSSSSSVVVAAAVQAGVLRIALSLARRNPQWLLRERKLFETLYKFWVLSVKRGDLTAEPVQSSSSSLSLSSSSDQSTNAAANTSLADQKQQSIVVLHISSLNRWNLLAELLLIFCQHEPSAYSLLFDVLDLLLYCPASVGVASIKEGLQSVLRDHYLPSKRQEVLGLALKYLSTNTGEVSVEKKIYIIRLLVTPIVYMSFSAAEGGEKPKNNSESPAVEMQCDLPPAVVAAIKDTLWKESSLPGAPPQSSSIATSESVEDNWLKLEQLQVMALFSCYSPSTISDYRKDIIMFAWSFLKHPDIITRYAAYVALSYFIQAFDTPQKFINQTFVTLLRAQQSESRSLVRQGLDVLLPSLPLRLQEQPAQVAAVAITGDVSSSSGSGGNGISSGNGVSSSSSSSSSISSTVPLDALPTWVRWTRKVLIEDGFALPQLISVWQLIVRHSQLFYPYREHFVTLIVSSLGKLGLMASATLETRMLTIDLVELVLRWERIRVGKLAGSAAASSQPASPKPTITAAVVPQKRKAASSTAVPSTPQQSPSQPSQLQSVVTVASFTPGTGYREMIINYLIRFICTLNEPLQRKGVSWRILDIARGLYQPTVWNHTPVKLQFLEKFFASTEINEQTATNFGNLLQLLTIVGREQPPEWFLANQAQLQLCIEKCLLADYPKLTECLLPLLQVIYGTGRVVRFDQLTVFLQTQINERINSGKSVYNFIPALLALSTSIASGNSGSGGSGNSGGKGSSASPAAAADPCAANIVRFFHKLCKEPPPPTSSAPNHHAQQQQQQQQSQQSQQQQSQQQQSQQQSHGSHANTATTATGGGAPQQQQNTAALQAATAALYHSPVIQQNLAACLQLLRSRLHLLGGDGKKIMLVAIQSLIDRLGSHVSPPSDSTTKLLDALLDTFEYWLFASSTNHSATGGAMPGVNSGNSNNALTMKEKSILLLRFGSVVGQKCQRATWLRFLHLVLRVYQEPSMARTELTVRLEPLFLQGCVSDDPTVREKFMQLFDRQLPRDLFVRFMYVLGVQNWEALSNRFWLQPAVDLLLSMVPATVQLASEDGNRPLVSLHSLLASSTTSASANNAAVSAVASKSVRQAVQTLAEKHVQLMQKQSPVSLHSVLAAFQQLSRHRPVITEQIWLALFTGCWSAASAKQRHDLNKALVTLLTKDFYHQNINNNSNNSGGGGGNHGVVYCLLDAAARCRPVVMLPPQVVKYLGKQFNAWHPALEILEQNLAAIEGNNNNNSGDDLLLITPLREPVKLQELTLDAIAELLFALNEEDQFIGLWRRRCIYPETNAALSYEQIGRWQQAQQMYESAQLKARNGLLPFSESEYSLWESRWIHCAQKLQQWDLCSDLARHDNNIELQLECAWRLTDWSADREGLQNALMIVATDQPTPRHKVFEAFLALTQVQENVQQMGELQAACDSGIQLTLRHWHNLPRLVGSAHLPLLALFQQFVELQEASHIYVGVSPAGMQGRMQAVQELKGTLGTWRERLPNLWDDINVWSELVAWRQHVFSVVNKAYQPLAEQPPAGNSLAYRGYHEIAWIINRFAHVARKYNLIDVCVNALTKIYTLPNIEIHDAFLKLREQAKCYLQESTDLSAGLDVINNTNLGYFQQAQRSEFFTLKGVFLQHLQMQEEAQHAFSGAIQIDVNLAVGWAKWGQFNDQLFHRKLQESAAGGGSGDRDLTLAAHAVNCYLNAAGLFKNHRSRKYLARILWLLGQDDESQTISRAFEAYKGDMPVWHWISFVPQLLVALGKPEARLAKKILIRIAKSFPQALYYHLRCAREGFTGQRLQATAANMQQQPQHQSLPITATTIAMDVDSAMDEDLKGGGALEDSAPSPVPSRDNSVSGSIATTTGQTAISGSGATTREPWEHVEEIMSILKTAYPLLALSMESMVDQLLGRLKPTVEEDVCRVLAALLVDSQQQLACALADPKTAANALQQPLPLPLADMIDRFIQSPLIAQSKYYSLFQQDFAVSRGGTMGQLVEKCRRWHEHFDRLLSSRKQHQQLENFSHYLVEFGYQRFDEVEVPGQYLALRESNTGFVKIDRFLPEFEFVSMNNGSWYRRVHILGNDGTRHAFVLQNPCSRDCRREEQLMQLLRMLNSALGKRKEAKRRDLEFHCPLIVPLSPTVRLVQDNDFSYISLQSVLNDSSGSGKSQDCFVAYLDRLQQCGRLGKHPGQLASRLEAFRHVQETVCSDTQLDRFVRARMNSFTDLWTLRKLFTQQLAGVLFSSYVFSITQRMPHKLLMSMSRAAVWQSDLVPCYASTTSSSSGSGGGLPQLAGNKTEPTPFRLTPNLQRFITPTGIEGLLAGSLVALGTCLSPAEYSSLEDLLSLFIREDMEAVCTPQLPAPNTTDSTNYHSSSSVEFQQRLRENVKLVVSRINQFSCSRPTNMTADDLKTPFCEPVLQLLSQATNPENLAAMDMTWQPWL